MSNRVLPSPRNFGSYQVVATLGQGGMGRVHLVRDANENYYAAKELLSSPEEWSATQLKRFELECDILARLDSPHIVKPVGGIQKWNRIYFYLMEYVPGKNLQQILKTSGRFSPKIATHYMIQLLTALETAHAKQIVHRDIKPSNLIINPEGVLKVTDFGIAFDLNATHFTQTGCFLGTPYTISPEQARGEESVPASDLYSLGIVFYELLTGSPPFQAKNTLALLYQHQEKQPPSLKEWIPEIPSALEEFLACCLRKLPQDRFESAQEAKKQLEQIFCEFSNSPEEIIQTTQALGAQSALVLEISEIEFPDPASRSKRRFPKKWKTAGFVFLWISLFCFLGWAFFSGSPPIQHQDPLQINIQIRLKDQTLLAGEWVRIQKRQVLYRKDSKSASTSVPLENIAEIQALKNIFPEVEIFFHENETANCRVQLLGIEQGDLYGIDSQHQIQVFSLASIREYEYRVP
ncbi:MAG: serine/threonine-protein kinase [Planctomycetota bacterium]